MDYNNAKNIIINIVDYVNHQTPATALVTGIYDLHIGKNHMVFPEGIIQYTGINDPSNNGKLFLNSEKDVKFNLSKIPLLISDSTEFLKDSNNNSLLIYILPLKFNVVSWKHPELEDFLLKEYVQIFELDKASLDDEKLINTVYSSLTSHTTLGIDDKYIHWNYMSPGNITLNDVLNEKLKFIKQSFQTFKAETVFKPSDERKETIQEIEKILSNKN